VHFAGIFIRLRTKIIYKLSSRINVFMETQKVLPRVCSVAVLGNTHSLVNGELYVLSYMKMYGFSAISTKNCKNIVTFWGRDCIPPLTLDCHVYVWWCDYRRGMDW
jgi:hypothetical protein